VAVTDFRPGGKEAFDRFSKVMIKVLVSHSSHPIFASNEFTDAIEHKWAALAGNKRMLVQGLHIPSFYIIALIVFYLLGWSFRSPSSAHNETCN
jgi:hypothetical protein